MRIDLEYIKNFLDIILENDKSDFTINHEKIRPLWNGDDGNLEKLVFHMEILEDQGFIVNPIDSSGIGFGRTGRGGITVSIITLRLTALGHDFASNLAKPGVFDTLTTSFKNEGPKEVVKITFALAKKALDKKLDKFLSD